MPLVNRFNELLNESIKHRKISENATIGTPTPYSLYYDKAQHICDENMVSKLIIQNIALKYFILCCLEWMCIRADKIFMNSILTSHHSRIHKNTKCHFRPLVMHKPHSSLNSISIIIIEILGIHDGHNCCFNSSLCTFSFIWDI